MCSTLGVGVSIHSRSAPFSKAVTQSRTTRSMLVSSRKLYKPLAKRLGRTSLPLCLSKLSFSLAVSRVTSSISIKSIYLEAKSPGSFDTGIFCVSDAPSESVRATITPSSTPSSRNA